MSCIPSTLVLPQLGCTPTIGGIEKIEIGTNLVNSITIDGCAGYTRNSALDEVGQNYPYAWSYPEEVTYWSSTEVVSAGDTVNARADGGGQEETVDAVHTPSYKNIADWAFGEMDVMPEQSTYNSTYAYDKITNVGLWTTTVTLSFGEYTEDVQTLLNNLHYKYGRPVKLHTKNGLVVTVPEAKWTASEITPGTQLTDQQTGTITLTAVHKAPLSVATSNI